MVWSFARADQMVNHNFVDDVAVTLAISKRHAIRKFSKYYKDVNPDEVTNITQRLLRRWVVVLTDY